MSRKYTREGLAADIGAASSYSNQYYYNYQSIVNEVSFKY